MHYKLLRYIILYVLHQECGVTRHLVEHESLPDTIGTPLEL